MHDLNRAVINAHAKADISHNSQKAVTIRIVVLAESSVRLMRCLKHEQAGVKTTVECREECQNTIAGKLVKDAMIRENNLAKYLCQSDYELRK